MPAIKWLRLLMNHIPDRYEHLVRYYGYYSKRSRGARRLIENGDDTAASIHIDEPPANTRRKATWPRLILKAYDDDPLECVNCGSNMRIIALIDNVDVVERILKHLKVWDPQPDTITPAGPDPPLPQGETRSPTNHPVPQPRDRISYPSAWISEKLPPNDAPGGSGGGGIDSGVRSTNIRRQRQYPSRYCDTGKPVGLMYKKSN